MLRLFALSFVVAAVTITASVTPYHFNEYELLLTPPSLPHASRLRFPSCPPPEQRITLDLVKDYGAVGDNKTLNTAAFLAAIQKISEAGGGELRVGSGIFLTQPFILTSCMTLNLYSTKSFIQAVTNISLWPVVMEPPIYRIPSLINDNTINTHKSDIESNGLQYAHFISGAGLTDISIIGDGIIDAGGYMWWIPARAGTLPYRRGNLVVFYSSQYISFINITVQNSPQFNYNPIQCQHILGQNIKVLNPNDSVNTDGWDPQSSNNVTLLDSYIHTGDDAVAVKANAIPSTNILVANLTVGSGHCGMCIGSHAYGGGENITVRDSHYISVVNGFCFKGSRGTGGDVYNYSAYNIHINYAHYSAIALNDYYPGSINGSSIGPKLNNVHITNLTAEYTGRDGGIIVGLDVALMTNIHLRHVRILKYAGADAWNCSYSSGTYYDVYPSISHCAGFKPENNDDNSLLSTL